MPELSRFYGIIITMNAGDHNPPHFHAEYNGDEAIFDINNIAFLKGSLPTKQSRLVLAWAEIHKEDLLKNWENLSSNNQSYEKIPPLN